MLWWRVAARPDRRMAAASAGIAFAILLPVAGTLVLQGLEPRIEGDWVAYRTDGAALPGLLESTHTALWLGKEDGVQVAAFTAGDPIVATDQAMGVAADAEGVRARTLAPRAVPLVPPGHVLVHPDTVPAGAAHVMLLSRHVAIDGARVEPARGADAFERAGLQGLQAQTGLLVAASVPAVALVAAAFSDQEARRRARTAATLAALGRPRLGRRLLALRVLVTVALGALLATAMGYVMWRFGGATFHPEDARPRGIAVAIAVPALLGGLAGVLWGMRRLGSGEARLRTPPAETDLPGWRLPWLPTPLRPLALGTRVVPLLVLAGLLFAIDIGFPVAAAGIPAAVAGERGEWVVGAQAGIVLGGQTLAAPADVMALDPDIDAIVAETIVPTLVDGAAAILRGGDLDALASYHGLHVRGDPGLVLGQRLAEHIDARRGDVVAVQASHRPMVLHLPVTGIFTGGGLLEDEALIDAETARTLTGVPAGEATVLRMRPDDLAARDALGRQEPRIVVTQLRLEPAAPVAGQLATAHIDVANLGAGAGSRVLPVRVNGIVAASMTASVPGYGQASISAPFIAPSGPFTVEVNPTASGQAAPADIVVQAPLVVFLPDAVEVRVLRDGAPEATTVELLLGDTLVATGPTDAEGRATLQAAEPGRHVLRAEGVHRVLRVSPAEARDETRIEVGATWLTPDRPPLGSQATWRAEIVNVGGVAGTASVPFERDGTLVATRTVELLPGQATVVEVDLLVTQASMRLEVAGKGMDVVAGAPPSPGSAGRNVDARTAGSLQVDVADRVLGDAQRALVGMGAIALAAILAVVYLGTERTLQGRRHVVRTLHALGLSPEQVRYRAAWEAAAMAGAAFLVAAMAAKLVFITLGAIGWPRPFAHALPDPMTWIFLLQAGTAFAGAAALAAYMASGRVLEGT